MEIALLEVGRKDGIMKGSYQTLFDIWSLKDSYPEATVGFLSVAILQSEQQPT